LTGRLSGAVVPHAPLLLSEVAGEGKTPPEIQRLRRAMRALVFHEADLVVLLSAHAPASGVYGSVAGTLDDFGIRGIHSRAPTDPAAVAALADRWNKPVLDHPIDHGVLVPLKLLPALSVPIVAAGVGELQPDAALTARGVLHDARAFAGAVMKLARTKTIALLASAHTASALTPRAPLTERPEVKPVENGVRRALDGDPGALGPLVLDLWKLGGSCSPAPLAAYACAFAGRKSEVLAYGSPFGVGYVVARTM
jgi:hypothetical protein